MPLQLLVSPLARGAYFADTLAVARAELASRWPDAAVRTDRRATIDLLEIDLPPEAAPDLARRSFVQAIFTPAPGGMTLLDADPGFTLPEGLVFGAKYRGKTHELVTQLALNLALDACRAPGTPQLLDPMAGRGTTLLWAARYGISATGVEQDPKALADLQRHVGRQTRLGRIKHRTDKGFTGRKNKDGVGRYWTVGFPSADVTLVTGDSRQLPPLLRQRQFALMVADLPYGVQFHGAGRRNPVEVLAACAPGWAQTLLPGGALALIFNRLQPKRPTLQRIFEEVGLEALPIEAPHRMSESIWRDLLVLRKAP